MKILDYIRAVTATVTVFVVLRYLSAIQTLHLPVEQDSQHERVITLPRTTQSETSLSATDRPLSLPPIVQKSLHLDSDKLSTTIPNATNATRIALCHKSLFGDIDLYMIIDWVAYHRLLGFDRIFMSYIPGIEQRPGFEVLRQLPYLTLFENTAGTIILANNVRQGYQRLGGPVAQQDLEERCLDQDAVDYDWVLLSDADEYLWFSRNISVHEFVQEYENKGYDYISFGKVMYTMKHRVETSGGDSSVTSSDRHNKPFFQLCDYPFNAGPFCTMPSKRGLVCARKNGRAKVMVKPAVHHGSVRVHGTHVPTRRKESIHVLSNIAHLKEWNAATVVPDSTSVVVRSPVSFAASSAEEIDIYGFKLYPKDENGSVAMEFDNKLRSWFDFVASRGSAT